MLSTPTKTARQHILESGIPIPRPEAWSATRTYRANEFVIYKGAAYEALNENTNVLPTVTTDWVRVGADDRIPFVMSVYAHGPFSGTAGTGGKTTIAKAYTYNGDGTVSKEFLNTVTSSVYHPFFDPFVDDPPAEINAFRVVATGQTWSSDAVGAWLIDRNDSGGWATPPATGKTHRWFVTSFTDPRLAVTWTADPGTTRLMGIIFRRSDANNFWIATQTGLYKIVAGAARANPASGALTWTKFTTGERMKVSITGNAISVYRNETLLGTATDAFNNTAGQHGLGTEA